MTDDVLVLLRLDEPHTNVLPSDAADHLADMLPSGTIPSTVDAFAGFGRSFIGSGRFEAQDKVSGTTLATRDVTVQALVQWDIASQGAAGNVGAIWMRGKASAAAEYIAYGLELRVVNASLRIGELRMRWQTVAGVDKVQVGGHFVVPDTGFLLLTASRRRVSATEVQIDYFVNGDRIARIDSIDGDIGGGTTGTTTFGSRFNGSFVDNLRGIVDEVRVLERTTSAEEVRATWLRMAYYQELGLSLWRSSLPPGWPFAQDAESRAGRDDRVWGHALGFAAGQIENVRDNIMPDRAYGLTLVEWETILRLAPRPGDSVEKRRARVLGHWRQRKGIAIPGVAAALGELLSLHASQFDIRAFTDSFLDTFASLLTYRWRLEPSAQWTLSSGALRLQNAFGTSFYSALVPVDGTLEKIFAKFSPTTINSSFNAGLLVYDMVTDDRLHFGLRNNGGTYEVFSEIFLNGISQGVVVHATTSLANHWFKIDSYEYTGFGNDVNKLFRLKWSTTGPTSGFSSVEVTFRRENGWIGLFGRTDGTAGGLDVSFDDVEQRNPRGKRPFHFYVYRDPALPGAFDIVGAQLVLDRLKHAHTFGAVVTALHILCDTPGHGCDEEPMGGF